MALSKCKECGKGVSDNAISCPHCGAPLPTLSEGQIKNIAKQSVFARSRWLGGTAFFFGLAWLFFAAYSISKSLLSLLRRLAVLQHSRRLRA